MRYLSDGQLALVMISITSILAIAASELAQYVWAHLEVGWK